MAAFANSLIRPSGSTYIALNRESDGIVFARQHILLLNLNIHMYM